MSNAELKPGEYDDALKNFLAEEEERRQKFDAHIEEKAKKMELHHKDNLKLSKVRIEAEIARQKMAIDAQFKEKSKLLWENCEEEIQKLTAKTEADIEQMIKNKTAELQKKIDDMNAFHRKQMEMRNEQFQADIKAIETALKDPNYDEAEADRRQFLKKELVAFKSFPATTTIADEEAMSRMGITIKKQALITSGEYILYRAKSQRGDGVVKIVVLQDRTAQYRNNIGKCSKVAAYLMNGGEGGKPRHSAFIALHYFFIASQKTYCFMAEVSTVSLETKAKSGQLKEKQLKEAMRQVLEGLVYMHDRAIAHLNLRGESILFADDGATTKIAGLGYAEHYFNADTETFFKIPKVDRRKEFLPTECYLEDRFDPAPVDVYCFGYLLYAATSDMKKKHRQKKIGHVELGNFASSDPGRALVEATSAKDPAARPKYNALKGNPYFA